MTRTITVSRRRPGIVDTYVPKVYGVAGYRLKAATNFDVAFTTILTSTNVGFVGDGVDRRVIDTQPLQNRVRFVWNPTDYGLDDTQPVWVKLYHVNGGGVETEMSAPTLITPDDTQFLHRGAGHLMVRGTAPLAADASGALQLDFPRLQTDWRVLNEDPIGNAFVAFEPGGPENLLRANSLTPQLVSFKAHSASIWVRGSDKPVLLSIHTTNSNPP